MIEIRKARKKDLPFLIELEKASFDASRQFKASSIRHSVKSSTQNVYVLLCDGVLCGSATVFCHDRSWRLYSIAISVAYRKKSLGQELVKYIIDDAQKHNIRQLTLEADANEPRLVAWYESLGFAFVCELPDFYGVGQPGKKMSMSIPENPRFKKNITNIVVVDQDFPWLKAIDNIEVISAEQFINDEKYQTNKDMRVFNLCSSYSYQTMGYYVSLLASARNLRGVPNVATIEDFTDETITESIGEEVEDLIQKSLKSVKADKIVLRIFFEKAHIRKYAKLARAIYRLFETPLLECTFEKERKWSLVKVTPLTLNDVELSDSLEKSAKSYFSQKRFANSKIKQYKYDLAILVDPAEPAPPSGNTALARFEKAAEKIGFYTEFITQDDFQRVSQFDALFIRATTNVKDFTYQFSRYAYSEGLVVIDDPWSILKCSNKIYFYESMKKQGVSTPKTVIVSPATSHKKMIEALSFPIVLKRPDSASSMGVFKVHCEKELDDKLDELFKTSELIIAQEYLPSSFDWRVGILGGKPLYVCKYYMAKNHWQIYNWGTNKVREQVGGVDTLLVEDAPKDVVDTALRAAAAMGDGFYGVDLKTVDDKIYVIEVNDNPSIDHGWEDKILGEELYLKIMRYFFASIETARNIKPRISKKK